MSDFGNTQVAWERLLKTLNLLYLFLYLFQVPNEHLKTSLHFTYWLWRACKQVTYGLKRDQMSLQDNLSLVWGIQLEAKRLQRRSWCPMMRLKPVRPENMCEGSTADAPGGSARLHHLRSSLNVAAMHERRLCSPPHTCVVYNTAAILAGAGWHTHVCICRLKRHRGD